MRELRGEWVEEPTTSCPTKEANPEMFHAQYALSQKEVRGLVSWRDTGRVQCSQGLADDVMVSALFKSKGVGPGRREATVYGLADLFKQFWVLGCRETLAGTRAGERARGNGRLCILRRRHRCRRYGACACVDGARQAPHLELPMDTRGIRTISKCRVSI
jgi:hypothetical protein